MLQLMVIDFLQQLSEIIKRKAIVIADKYAQKL